MAVTALDTHEVVKELIAAGFSDVQAEAVTRQLRRAQDIDLSNVMTKSDGAALGTDVKSLGTEVKSLGAEVKSLATNLRSLDNNVKQIENDVKQLENRMNLLEINLKAEIKIVEKSVKADIAGIEKKLAETQSETLKWLVGTMGVQTVVILGSVVTLIRFMSH